MDDHWALYNRTTQWRLVFSFLPRRCEITDRKIWWEWCYRGFTFITGPGEPVEQYVYLAKDSFIIERLAGRIK
jgi:hypothetical protein